MKEVKKCDHNPLFTIDYEYDNTKVYKCPFCKKIILADDPQTIKQKTITLYDFVSDNNLVFTELINRLLKEAKENNQSIPDYLEAHQEKLYNASIPDIISIFEKIRTRLD